MRISYLLSFSYVYFTFIRFVKKTFFIILTAVRYGRVPKRSRELCGSNICDNGSMVAVTTIDDTSTPPSSLRIDVVAPLTPQNISQLCSSAVTQSTDANSFDSDQACDVPASPTTITTTTATTTNSNSTSASELSVYELIICVSQAHRSNCTYTDELTVSLSRRPIQMSAILLKDEFEVHSVA